MKTVAELKIALQVDFAEWRPSVGEDYEDAYSFRIYNDGVWEFLNKEGTPISQGVDAKFMVFTEQSAEKK